MNNSRTGVSLLDSEITTETTHRNCEEPVGSLEEVIAKTANEISAIFSQSNEKVVASARPHE